MLRRLLLLACLLPATAQSATLTGTVTKVYDGDTITIRDAQGRKEKIRLLDVDAPEKGQQHSRITQSALSDRIGLKQVRIEWKKRDDYGRIVGAVFLGEENINHWLIDRGYAWRYRYSRNQELKSVMMNAREARRGLWAIKDPMDPWLCRRAKEKGNKCR
jgi:micrococcal nuclease